MQNSIQSIIPFVNALKGYNNVSTYTSRKILKKYAEYCYSRDLGFHIGHSSVPFVLPPYHNFLFCNQNKLVLVKRKAKWNREYCTPFPNAGPQPEGRKAAHGEFIYFLDLDGSAPLNMPSPWVQESNCSEDSRVPVHWIPTQMGRFDVSGQKLEPTIIQWLESLFTSGGYYYTKPPLTSFSIIYD